MVVFRQHRTLAGGACAIFPQHSVQCLARADMSAAHTCPGLQLTNCPAQERLYQSTWSHSVAVKPTAWQRPDHAESGHGPCPSSCRPVAHAWIGKSDAAHGAGRRRYASWLSHSCACLIADLYALCIVYGSGQIRICSVVVPYIPRTYPVHIPYISRINPYEKPVLFRKKELPSA